MPLSHIVDVANTPIAARVQKRLTEHPLACVVLERLLRAGHPTFVVGGLVREAVWRQDCKSSPALTGDVDLATAAPPHLLRRILGDLPHCDRTLLHKGILRLGEGVGGVDVASLRQWGEHLPAPEASNPPVSFGSSLCWDSRGRDFCFNALYFDPRSHLLVDPTGRGLADAARRNLHLTFPPLAALDHRLIARYMRFRIEGYSAEAPTRAAIIASAATFGSDFQRLAQIIRYVLPESADHRVWVNSWLDLLRQERFPARFIATAHAAASLLLLRGDQ